ncbi:hypothetical protein H1Z61_14210 [Bacillus aquiflavi]|uniref:DUF1129 domain-containing protein n=1 Tax=Bacillus aquiflavi TaxID=2672567 RepID=A0A6B3W1M1_9BACI|nr:permease prefix domain 1-containing protein [Bacillus aquiflavi]MBA4538256.1 hypothetical protein [Bacillus aquiflavi]NEY82575.1 hypothetical protein [Bacillus aquiflavi]UAC48634.1 YkyA family protein [Bacillus aquiflavi]
MDELQLYIESLFKKYKNEPKIIELKEEILGNLEDKVEHLKAQGLTEKAAIEEAKKSITTIDPFIDSHVPIKMSEYQFKAFQLAYLNIIIVWILTIPYTILSVGVLLNYALLVTCFILGALYLYFAKNKNKEKIGHINIKSILKLKKTALLLCGLYIAVHSLYLSAILFGSNIWFARTVQIDGPYQLAVIVAQYTLPLFSIIIPLTLHVWIKLIPNYKVENAYE